SGGKLSAADVKKLLASSKDGGKVTATEKTTLKYLADKYGTDIGSAKSSTKGKATARGGTSSSSSADDYYIEIEGVKYDRALLALAESLASSKGVISVADAKKLADAKMDSGKVTATEKKTIEYIKKEYKLSPAAIKAL
ncbi:MAG: hypothetical protein GWP75_03865, partial [Planctomycetia bacterium]|nr:hypothetical protein [Planctomycetia bacterium]